jgi:hypothetical protein
MFAVCTVLGIVAVFAGYVPTRRAVRVDPAVVLAHGMIDWYLPVQGVCGCLSFFARVTGNWKVS